MDEKSGSQENFSYLEPRIESRENLLINKIITTMSYSKVKKDGFPVFENMDHYWVRCRVFLLYYLLYYSRSTSFTISANKIDCAAS